MKRLFILLLVVAGCQESEPIRPIGPEPGPIPTAVPPSTDPFSFTKTRLGAGTHPQDIWGKGIGDINGDGLLDPLAGGSADSPNGGIYWFDTANSFASTEVTSNSSMTDIATCDIDNDGDVDVVQLGWSDIRYHENNGDGTSWTERTVSFSRYLHDIEAFDMDHDGDCDLVGRDQSYGQSAGDGEWIYIFENDGTPANGAWTETSLAIAGDGEGLLAYDLDGDGDIDTVTNESWQENDGAGNFTDRVFQTTWTNDHAFVEVGDIDNDGNPDIVLTPSEVDSTNREIAWFKAPADPTSSTEWTKFTVAASYNASVHSLVLGDFDGDSRLDIMTAKYAVGQDPDNISIWRGSGSSWTENVIATTGSHSMRGFDADGDGDLDAFGADWQGDNNVYLYTNNTVRSTEALDSWSKHNIGSSSVASGEDPNTPFIAYGDVDGDGFADLGVGNAVFINPCTVVPCTTIGNAWTKQTIGTGNDLSFVDMFADLDDDGDLDIVGEGSLWSPYIRTATNNGSGVFTVSGATVATGTAPSNALFAQGIQVARFGSGHEKRVMVSWYGDNGTTTQLEYWTVPANPLNSWGSPVDTGATVLQDEDLSQGDIDRDGDIDFFQGSYWIENTGSGFTQHRAFVLAGPGAANGPDRNELADINNDGRLDAVVGNEGIGEAGRLAWYEAPADPTVQDSWTTHVISDAMFGPMSLDVKDMDRDGCLDVVAGEHQANGACTSGVDCGDLIIFRNTGANCSGTSWSQHTIFTGDEHHDGARIVDLDRDGDLDVVSIGWFHTDVNVYENTSGGAPVGGTGGAGGAGATGGTIPPGITRPSAGCGLPGSSGAVSTQTIDVNGTTREYSYHVPTPYVPSEPLPLFFNFHEHYGSHPSDGNGNMLGHPNEGVFVWPQGVPVHPLTGDGWDLRCSSYDMDFFDELLAEIGNTRCIDLSRVFAYGYSYGAQMSIALTCCYDYQTVRAIAPVSGGYEDHPWYEPECDGIGDSGFTNPGGVMLSYGDLDPYFWTQQDFEDIITRYRADLGCSASWDPITINDCRGTLPEAGNDGPVRCNAVNNFANDATQDSDFTCKVYQGCDRTVQDCFFKNMGHDVQDGAWDDAWKFFATFTSEAAGGTGGAGGVGGVGGIGGVGGTGGTGATGGTIPPSALSIDDFSMTPPTQNVDNAPGSVTCNVTATSSPTAVKEAGCVLISPNGVKRSCIARTGAGDIWTCVVPIRQDDDDGLWSVDHLFARDTNLLLVKAGAPDTVDIDSPNGDVTPPDITGFSRTLSTDPISSAAGGTVTCNITATDTSALLDEGCTFRSPGGTESASCVAAGSCVASVPAGAEQGTWTLYDAFTRDVLGNLKKVDAATVEGLNSGHSTFTVGP